MRAILYIACFIGLLVLHPPSRAALRVNVCSPCQPGHPRPRPLNISAHLHHFIYSLDLTRNSIDTTLQNFLRSHDMEDRDDEYPALPPPHHCRGNKLVDNLVSAYRSLTDVVMNLTIADRLDVSGGHPQNHAHLRPTLCQLWLSLYGLGHHAPCTACLTEGRVTSPSRVGLTTGESINYFYISYKRAIQTLDTIRGQFS